MLPLPPKNVLLISSWVGPESPHLAAVESWNSRGEAGTASKYSFIYSPVYSSLNIHWQPAVCCKGKGAGNSSVPRSQHGGTLQGASLPMVLFNSIKNTVSTRLKMGSERLKLEGMDLKYAVSTASCESELRTSIFLSLVSIVFFPVPLWCQALSREESQLLMLFLFFDNSLEPFSLIWDVESFLSPSFLFCFTLRLKCLK